jgi:glutathione S-transferase
MNDHLLGSNPYLCGNEMTIADDYGAAFVALAELTGSDFSGLPNVRAWLDRMKGLKNWAKVNEVIDGFGASLQGQPLQDV